MTSEIRFRLGGRNDSKKMKSIKYLKDHKITDKKILLRVDYNVSMDEHHKISNDTRITQSLPTIKQILPHNKLIIVSHLNRPEGREEKDSLAPVVTLLKHYLPHTKITLVDDFEKDKKPFEDQKNGEILVLENVRFYPGEAADNPKFAKELANLGDIYVNDAFGVDHRATASVVGITKYLPSYSGFLLEQEMKSIMGAIEHPKKPLVTIIGGAKVSDKIKLINKLITIADHVLLGGGLANPFLKAQGFEIGKSIIEPGMEKIARDLMALAKSKHTEIILPTDVVVGDPHNDKLGGIVCEVESIPTDLAILDIGPDTQARFGAIIARAKTIVWNGPVGLFENREYRQGTDFIYYSIVHNPDAISIVGGGDTLAAISKKEYINQITHISTGGGAMLELIEKGTLPGIEALKQ